MDQKSASGLRLHTSILPNEPSLNAEGAAGKAAKRFRIARKHTGKFKSKSPSREVIRRKHSSSERLLRNTAIACALLLAVMALGNINSPFTNRMTSALKNVISMDVNLDQTLGRLSFVQNMMPESALVFLNLDDADEPALPVSGQIVHEWSKAQPWVEYITQNSAAVRSIQDGNVIACTQSEDRDYTVLIEHADGSRAVYAYLSTASITTGESVLKGEPIGISGTDENARLYFECRINDSPCDPALLTGKADA